MKRRYALFFLLPLLMMACEDIIHPTLQEAQPIYVIDAFINNKLDTQFIRISYSQPYFQQEFPPPVLGAIVTIADDSVVYPFTENPNKEGEYIWLPSPDEFGTVGRTYTLSVQIKGENFTAQSKMGRVPQVDSISFEPNERTAAEGVYYTAQFWARDPEGVGDTYWIKAFKNDTLLDRPSEINIAYDAAFSKGSNFDGIVFIQPIRNGINRFDVDENDLIISPYNSGDSVYVEIHSLTEASFDFLSQVVVETNVPGGFGQLFARPLSNVSTNIFNENPNGSQAQGFFNVGSVSGNGKRFLP